MKLVRDFMSTSVHAVELNDSVHDAAVLMADKTVSCLIVMDKGESKGIVTERDLIRKVLVHQKNGKKIKVKEIMSSPLTTVSPDEDLGFVSNIMKNQGIRRVPVVSNNKLIGIVTQTDVVHQTYELHKEHKKMELNQNIQSWIVLIALILTIILLYKLLA